jgi:serine/threonine-protein kinase CLA4
MVYDSKPTSRAVVRSAYWQAPEIATQQECELKVDVWALGILLIDMVERGSSHAEQQIFTAPAHSVPALKYPEQNGEDLKAFLAICLHADVRIRATSEALLSVS